MTDEEAKRELESFAVQCDDPDRPFRRAIRHALRAIEDRAYLAEKLYAVRLSDGVLIELDGMRRRIKGK